MNLMSPLPDDPAVALANGIAFCMVGAYPLAQLSLGHSLILDAENIRARYYLGIVQFRLCEYGAAVRTLNHLTRMRDAEAQLAADMLRRTYRLADGDPRFDVKHVTSGIIPQLMEEAEDSVVTPEYFARFLWPQSSTPGRWPDVGFELSITLGPRNFWLCTATDDCGMLRAADPKPVVLKWVCSSMVFDRIAAAQLFFLRALFEAQDMFPIRTPPQICQTFFPPKHQDVLLQRAYSKPAEMLGQWYDPLFGASREMIDRMILKRLD
jgi:hypothetical protein